MKNLIYIIPGIFFGIILTESEVISWFRIHKMFLFQEAHMYQIIGSAIAVGMVSVVILKILKTRSITREALNFQGKPDNKGIVYGGFIFGIGWAITGACPGPIFAQIGTGAYPALFTLIGAVAGAMLYASVRDKLPQ